MINWPILSHWQNWALVTFAILLIILTLNAVSGCACKEKD